MNHIDIIVFSLRHSSPFINLYLFYSLQPAYPYRPYRAILLTVDGIAARYFGQCSKFGAVLDMLTDRMGTSVLLVVLSHMYPSIWGIFAGLLVLDIVSHWYQMYATLVQGKTTHKGSDSSALLNFYYTFPYALLVCCCGNEFFIMSLYLMPHYPSAWLTNFAIINFPIFVFKQFMNVVQLWDSTQKLTAMDALEHNAKLAKKDQDVVAFTSSSPSGHGHSHGHGHSCGGHGHSH